MIGEVLKGKYELVRKLGEGGMGTVYEGRHVVLGRRVAVKLVNIGDEQREAEILERFMREAKATAAVDSEHIVEVIDVDQTESGKPYLVMEYLEGEDLSALLDREVALPPARAANLVVQACFAIGKAHAKGIIHRDLKPGNLFLTRREDGSERVKVLDFGIAKFRDTSTSLRPRLTATGVVLGTPYYLSPEQACGARRVDVQSDVYSMGVILFELLTGDVPFKGKTYNELIVNISTEDPVPPRVLRSDIPEELEAIVLCALARDLAVRYSSMEELAAALLPYCDDPRVKLLAPAGLPVPREPRISGEAKTDATAPTVARRPPTSAPRRARLLVVVAIVLAAGAGVGLYVSMTSSSAIVETGGADASGALATTAPPETASDAAPARPIEASAAPEPPADARPAAPPTTIQLAIVTDPPTARITIDGVTVESVEGAYAGRFPRDGAQHRVVVSAPGRMEQSRFVVFEADQSLRFELLERRRGGVAKRDAGPLDRDNPYGGP